MKVNIPVRLKNPWFWVGILSTILAAIGLSPEMFTSWALVWDAIYALLTNPFQLGCVIVAVLGVFIDPTTHGLKDSERVLTYRSPSKNK